MIKILLLCIVVFVVAGAGCISSPLTKPNAPFKAGHQAEPVSTTITMGGPITSTMADFGRVTSSPARTYQSKSKQTASAPIYSAKPISLKVDPATGLQYDQNSQTGPSQALDPNCPLPYRTPGNKCAVINEKNNTASLDGITCPLTDDPVCISNGMTLTNSCFLQYYSDETIVHKGKCLTPEEAARANNQGPDIKMIGIWIEPKEPVAGDPVVFHYWAQNYGTQSEPSYKINLYVDDVLVGSSDTKSLAVNAQDSSSWSNSWIATAGTHTYKICAEGQDTIIDVYPQNNCVTKTIIVGS